MNTRRHLRERLGAARQPIAPGGPLRVGNLLAVGTLLSLAAPALADTGLTDPSGTGWRLVEIVSMDDTIATPVEGRTYHLVFGTDGSVSVTADCRRATGALVTWDPPRLQ